MSVGQICNICVRYARKLINSAGYLFDTLWFLYKYVGKGEQQGMAVMIEL
jgi:hypothetical protein